MCFCIFWKYIHNIQFHWKIADASTIYPKSQLEGFLYLFFQVTLRYWELCDYLKIQRYCNNQAKRVKETPLLWHYWFFSIIKMLLWIYLYCKTTFASWYAKTNILSKRIRMIGKYLLFIQFFYFYRIYFTHAASTESVKWVFIYLNEQKLIYIYIALHFYICLCMYRSYACKKFVGNVQFQNLKCKKKFYPFER